MSWDDFVPDILLSANFLSLNSTVSQQCLPCFDWWEGQATVPLLTKFLFMLAYAVAIIMGLMYYIERCPWHWTRTYEIMYLVIAILIILFSSLLFELTYAPMMKQVLYGFLVLRRFSLIVLVIFAIKHMFDLRAFKPFFGPAAGERKKARKNLPESTNKGLRAKIALDSAAETFSENAYVLLPQSLLCFVMLGLYMLEEVAISFRRFPITFGILGQVLTLSVVVFFISGQIWALCGRHNARKVTRQEFARIIKERDADSFRFLLSRLAMPSLVDGCPELSDMLTDKPLKYGMYDTLGKAVVIDALQRLSIEHSKDHQEAAYRILLATSSRELTDLKNLVDGSGHYHCLYRLVYQDITDEDMRESLIRHLEQEARHVRTRYPCQRTKILSDLDDTVESSGGSFPAGSDRKYPKHVSYPGVLRLFKILDRGYDKHGPAQVDLVFLTARPHIYKGLMEETTYSKYRTMVADGLMHSVPTVIPGHLTPSVKAAAFEKCKGKESWRDVGELKNTSYRQYAKLYQEYDFIFCGDNGQGDLLAGERMVRNETEDDEVDTFQPNLLCVLIHKVTKSGEEPLALTPAELRGETWEQDLRARRLFMHETYVGAASDLFRAGFLSAAELREVAVQALEDFNRIRASNPWWEFKNGWSDAEDDMQMDLETANQIMDAEGLVRVPSLKAYEDLELDWSAPEDDEDDDLVSEESSSRSLVYRSRCEASQQSKLGVASFKPLRSEA